MKSQEVNFQKSQKLLASRAGSSKQTIARTAFTQPAIEIEWILNSYWKFWIGHLRGARSELTRWAVSVIFKKLPFVYLRGARSELTRWAVSVIFEKLPFVY